MRTNSNLKRVFYEFGAFRLIPTERLLFKNENTLSLSPKVFDALVLLVENQGHLIEKDELLDKLWADTFVEEATLARTISRLRKALDKNDNEKYIETIPKKGYRFSAEVNVIEEDLELNNASKKDEPLNKISDNKNASQIADNKNASQINENTENSRFGLKQIVAIGATLSLITLAIFYWQYKSPVNDKRLKVKSIAVLPFKFLDKDQRDKALELGMADTLITKLSNIEKIIIRPTRAIYNYADKDYINPAELGRELRVDATLDGTIQKDNQRLRITVQLVNSADGVTLWTEKFDAQEKDIFVLQDDISAQVAEALELELSGSEKQKLAKRYTEDPQAYKAYIEGRLLWSRRNPADFKRSLELFEKAIEIDPNYALAYTGLADSYQLFAEYRLMPQNEGFAKSRNAARKALTIDENLAEAHTSLGYTLAFYDWDFEAAEKEHKQAIKLNPNYATGHHWYGEYLMSMGRFDESKKHLNIAKKLDPLSPAVIANFATLNYLQGNYDETLKIGDELAEKHPQFPWGYISRIHAYFGKNMEKEYVESYLKVAESFYGNSDEQIQELKNAYEKKGWKALWQKRIEQMDNESNPRIYTAWEYAECNLRIGNYERSVEYLEKAAEMKIRWVIPAKYDPFWDAVRSNPKFQEIIKNIDNRKP